MATKRWIGQAAPTFDLWTISLSGTVTSQTYTVTINSKTVTYTSTGGDTVTTVLAALATALSATTIPVEFTELTATALPAGGPYTSLTMTQNVAGRPTTITVSTGGAATFSIAHTTTATGPNSFTNANNWSGGVAPANSDTLVFDSGSIPCKYDLSNSLTGVTISVEPGYSGAIGLPFINSDNNTTYAEYRTTSLTLAGGTLICNSASIYRCNVAFGANTTTARVLNTGQRPDAQIPVLLITGGNGSSELDVTKGDVGVAWYQGTTATFPTIKIGYATNPNSDASVIVGTGATLTTVTKNGGYFSTRSNVTTLTQNASGGKVDLYDAVAITTLNAYNGTVNYGTTGTIATINLYGKATLNADVDPRAKTVTNSIQVFDSTVTINDTQKTINSGTLTITGNGVSSLNANHGPITTAVFT